MEKTERKVFYARNMTELFYHVKTIADLKIVGGCTDIKTLPLSFRSAHSRPAADSPARALY